MNAASSRSHLIMSIRVDSHSPIAEGVGTSSKLHLVDLAGSERLSVTATAPPRFCSGPKHAPLSARWGRDDDDDGGTNWLFWHRSSTLCLTECCVHLHCMRYIGCAGDACRAQRTEATGSRLKEAQAINKSLSALGSVMASLASKDKHVPYRNSNLTYFLQDSLGGNSKTVMFVNISPTVASAQETDCSLKFAERVRTVTLGKATKAGGGGKSGSEGGLAEATRARYEKLVQEKEQQVFMLQQELKAVRTRLRQHNHALVAMEGSHNIGGSGGGGGGGPTVPPPRGAQASSGGRPVAHKRPVQAQRSVTGKRGTSIVYAARFDSDVAT
jgi:hypothetical protein